jgi:hypothetical protein
MGTLADNVSGVAVSVIIHLGGDPFELLAAYDAGWPLRPAADAPGLIYHACLALPRSMKLIAHFATEADALAFLALPGVDAALAAHTLVDGRPAVVPIHAYELARREE